jgi:hypothetical protein
MTRDPATGLRTLNPAAATGAAYPLATLSYGATVPSKLSVQEAKELGALIRYAVGPGQVPGTEPGELPAGYVPLGTGLRTEALGVAGAVEKRVGYVPPASPTNDLGPAPAGGAAGAGGSGAGGAGTPSGAGPATAGQVPPPVSSNALSHAVPVAAVGKPAQVPTPGLAVGLVRYALVAALIVGGAALILAPVLPRVARRFARSPG